MEREDRERIKNHIVKYFHGTEGKEGEEIAKRQSLHIFRGAQR
jgi:hypothetical protein